MSKQDWIRGILGAVIMMVGVTIGQCGTVGRNTSVDKERATAVDEAKVATYFVTIDAETFKPVVNFRYKTEAEIYDKVMSEKVKTTAIRRPSVILDEPVKEDTPPRVSNERAAQLERGGILTK